MALSDYHQCDNCGGKTFYDANLQGFEDPKTGHWLYGWEDIVGYAAFALCGECEKTHEIIIRPREIDNDAG